MPTKANPLQTIRIRDSPRKLLQKKWVIFLRVFLSKLWKSVKYLTYKFNIKMYFFNLFFNFIFKENIRKTDPQN